MKKEIKLRLAMMEISVLSVFRKNLYELIGNNPIESDSESALINFLASF